MAQAIEKKYVSAELEDGTVLGFQRVTLQEQVAWSRHCRMTKQPKDDIAVALAFFAHHIAARTGAIPESVTFKEWLDGYCVDVDSNDEEDTPGEGSDPTPASVEES